VTTSPVTASPAGLTFAELAAPLRTRARARLRSVLRDEVAGGRIRLDEDGRYALVVEAFPRDLLAALLGLSEDETAPATRTNSASRPDRDRSPLADDLAALLATEPVGLSCDKLASKLRRRRAVVLIALRSDDRFTHDGERRGSRWRLRDGYGTDNAPPRSRALAQLALARWEAVEAELEALRARLGEEGESAG
jgi:hypothetical protein